MGIQKKKVVVTGGAGFIGSQLGYELHQRGWDVVLIDNLWAGTVDNLIIEGKTFGTFIAKDVRVANLIDYFKGADYVVHLAGIAALPVCQSDPQFAYDVNTSATANVLEAARSSGVQRVLFSSTSAVYESNKAPVFFENDPVSPDLTYASTKVAAEQICKSFALNYGMDIVIPRFFNVYGPHQDFRRKSPPFTSYIARELSAGRPPVLFNNSDAKRDYVHSSDVIHLLIAMLESEHRFSAEIFNVASGKGYSVPELYSTMSRIAGKEIQPIYKDPVAFWDQYPSLYAGTYPLSRERVAKEVYKNAVGSGEKALKIFNWMPSVDIESGLRSVYQYADRKLIES